MANEKTMNCTREGDEWMINGQPAKTHDTDCARNKEWRMTFNVGTPTGRYEFTEDPFWVYDLSAGDKGCPSSFGCQDVFEVVDPGKTRLIVKNKNPQEAKYRYQLNVWDRVAQEHVPVDPILSNGGHD